MPIVYSRFARMLKRVVGVSVLLVATAVRQASVSRVHQPSAERPPTVCQRARSPCLNSAVGSSAKLVRLGSPDYSPDEDPPQREEVEAAAWDARLCAPRPPGHPVNENVRTRSGS